MEKIQSAISKAREARQSKLGTGPVRADGPTGVKQSQSDVAWENLPLMEPSMDRLRAQRIVTLDKGREAANLGFSLSRQMTSRVAISEMDLRKPSLRRILQLKTERNFTAVVRGDGTFEEHAVRVRPNLAIGMARNFVEHSAELLQNPALGKRLDHIEAQYNPTIMIFDMPPFQVSDDMMAFADKVDCVLIMAAT